MAIDPKLVALLENIRRHCDGEAVHINSAFRTASYNRSLPDSASKSQHLYGRAAVIWVGHYDKQRRPVRTKTPAQVAAIAETYLGFSGGIGIYSTFTHIDVRQDSARWNG